MTKLTETVYIEQTLHRLDMSQQVIVGIEFDGCTFDSCNLEESEFHQCKFHDCLFINCKLNLAQFPGCSFFSTVFEDCKAIGINWTQADWPSISLPSPLQFYRCQLNFCLFFGLSLQEIVLQECQLHEADFGEADCRKGDFTRSDLAKSIFHHTNLQEANFMAAYDYHIDVFNNNVKRAKFSLPEACNLLASLDIEILET